MTTFGEITEPVSRAAWEDWDEIIPENNPVELRWRCALENLTKTDLFLIFEGKYLSQMVTIQKRNNLELINSIPEVNLHLFRTKDMKMYVCIINNYNLVLSSEIVELLKPYLALSNDIVGIQTKPLAMYQSAELCNQDCLIRSITTTNIPSKDLNLKYPNLEQPNIITGVTAGVICLREFLNLPAKAIVCYIEHPEEYEIEGVQTLLKKLNIIQDTTSRPNTVLNSNLYI